MKEPYLPNKTKYEKIPHPKIKKVGINSNRLILPFLNNKIDENKSKNNIDKNDNIRKNIFSRDTANKNILSSRNTDQNFKKKNSAAIEQGKKTKYKLKLKEVNNNAFFSINSHDEQVKREKTSSQNINLFKRKNRKKCTKQENFPVLSGGKSSSKIKFPLIDQSSNKIKTIQKPNNAIIEPYIHKFKLDCLLDEEECNCEKKIATHTRKGTEENGKVKENNQDASIILNNVLNIENYSIYGIMDGHGSNGHLVSNFVKEKIEKYFNDVKTYRQKKLKKAVSSLETNDTNDIYEKLKYNDYEIIRYFFKKVDEELYDTNFDVHFSGTTCVLVFKIGQKIICSNVGDSRAVLINKKNDISSNKDLTKIGNSNYEFIELSHDHKPENKEERERIEKLGGEVAQEFFIGDEDKPAGPFRVWNKGCNYPGIAVSRSLGDKIAELIGVIPDPDILEFNIDDKSKYIIMGSDGVFEYLSNSDIMDITGSLLIKNNPDKACLDVIKKAAELFQEKEKRIDDITINIIIL
jgi:serine/threonine protein phosphatase PrpC